MRLRNITIITVFISLEYVLLCILVLFAAIHSLTEGAPT